MYYNNYGNQYCGNPLMQNTLGLKGRPVTSIEEARSANIDFDGSLFIFPDIANKKIYTKQINLDGTASMKSYSLDEIPIAAPAYVTKEEFDSTVKNLESLLKQGEKNHESTSNSSTKSTISF